MPPTYHVLAAHMNGRTSPRKWEQPKWEQPKWEQPKREQPKWEEPKRERTDAYYHVLAARMDGTPAGGVRRLAHDAAARPRPVPAARGRAAAPGEIPA